MIVYLDSSTLARAYLADEQGHDRAADLLNDYAVARVTGSWTRIEVAGALVRAARARPTPVEDLLAVLDRDLEPDGRVAMIAAQREEVERGALDLVRRRELRAMDA